MTGRILNINIEPGEPGKASPPEPRRGIRKLLPAVAALAALFAASTAILLRIIPQPHSSADYLIVGSFATLLCLLALFALVIKQAGLNFTRRDR